MIFRQIKRLELLLMIYLFNYGIETKLHWISKWNRTKRYRTSNSFHACNQFVEYFEQDKLLSRALLEQFDIDQTDIFDYVEFIDEIRFDDKSFINLSIQHPNSFCLTVSVKKQQKKSYTLVRFKNWQEIHLPKRHVILYNQCCKQSQQKKCGSYRRYSEIPNVVC